MDCARFERELTALLDDACQGAERERVLAALGEHVSGCTQCAGTADVLDLLALPLDERDPMDEADETYWATLSARIAERVEEDRSNASVGIRPAWIWSAVAAAVLVAAFAAWMLREQAWPGHGQTVAADQVAGAVDSDELRRDIAELIPLEPSRDFSRELETLEVFVESWELPWAAGFEPGRDDSEAESGWVFPDLDGLDESSRGALLEWLRENTAQQGGVRS